MSISMKDLRRLRASVRTLERELGLQLKDQTICCGVTMAQCRVLLELDSSGPLTVSGLAQALGLDKSTLSRSLDGMAAASLIERTSDPDDRRALNVFLSEKGRGVAQRINGECDAYFREPFDGLFTAQYRRILEAVEILAGAMKASLGLRASCCRGGVSGKE